MADPADDGARTGLSALVDPPLAGPPPLDDLERRARRLRRRRVTGRAIAATAAALAVVAGAVALVPHGTSQTVRTAAPGTATGADPTDAARAPVPPPPLSFTAPVAFPDGSLYKLVADDGGNGSICLRLVADVADASTNLACYTPNDQPAQAGLADFNGTLVVYGIVAPDVTAVAYGSQAPSTLIPLQLFGKGNPFPVQLVAAVVPSDVQPRAISYQRGGGGGVVLLGGPVEVHRRVDSINGATGAPGSTPPSPPASSSPPATNPPGTVPPPVGTNPMHVDVDPTAINLRKTTIASSAASGANGVAVRFWGGVPPCEVLGRVDVVETATTVTITVWTGTAANATKIACIDMAVYKEAIVTLKSPLGTRTVVDGAA